MCNHCNYPQILQQLYLRAANKAFPVKIPGRIQVPTFSAHIPGKLSAILIISLLRQQLGPDRKRACAPEAGVCPGAAKINTT